MKKIILISILILAVTGAYLVWKSNRVSAPEQIYCTQDAKMCPDGSYVGRVAPKCEFAACPVTAVWPTHIDTKYVGAVDWPPKLQIVNEIYSCNPAGTSEAPPGGMTGKVLVNGHEYCVTKESQGAAGTTYTMFAYALPRNNQTYIYTFSLKFPQCANYPDPQRIECQNDQNNFTITLNNLVDKAIYPQTQN